MRHRLFHTLVLSSLSLGCGGTHLAMNESDAGPQADAPATAADAAREDDASLASADAGSDAFDPRYCEPGWPTTKGAPRAVCVDAEGLVRAPSEVPCEAMVLCALGASREIGEPFDPSCCLLPPGTP